MQRMSRMCCRLTSQFLGNYPPQHIYRSTFAHTVNASNITCQRFKHTGLEQPKEDDTEQGSSQFSGYIPVEELEFSYSRSSGPGGQHVNKVNTKVELRFHVESASWISSDIKSKLIEMQRNRITKEGYLVLTSERTRKQMLNQADVMDKLCFMVHQAALRPRGLTEEEVQLRDKRLEKAKDQTLREKRQRSFQKQSRGGQ